jgi:purine-nucleoside phosphorylase
MHETFPITAAFRVLIDAARSRRPEITVVLGSGMSGAAKGLKPIASVRFAQAPGLAVPSVAGHQGGLVLGEWAGRSVLVFQGRLHYYEGHPWRMVLRPIHIAHFLGARILLLTNAAGGIRETLEPGSLMVIRGHLDWNQPPASMGWARNGSGQADISPYSPRLQQLLVRAAGDLQIGIHQGVYGYVLGPSFETPAEIRALRQCGADAVGMSTVREIGAGRALGMECAALSCITNRAAGLASEAINHQEVLSIASDQIPRLAALLEQFLALV